MARNRIVRTASVPAPVGGINAIDSVASMRPQFAVSMSNWWPTPFDVSVRNGTQIWGYGYTGTLTSLFTHHRADGTSKLHAPFVDTGTEALGDLTDEFEFSSVVSASLKYFESTNFANAGGSYLYIVGGGIAPRHVLGGSVGTPTITGITSSDITNVTAHKSRLWFTLKDSLEAAYLDTLAIAGAASKLDMRGLCKRGGHLVAATTWTFDGGTGIDDYLVFVSSEGDCVLWQGTDPTDAAAWSVVGVWQLAKPLGKRCFAQYGGDVIYLSREGVFPLSKALQSTSVSNREALSRNIEPLIQADAAAYGNNEGWQVMVFPEESALIVNVPRSSTLSHQWVMNTKNNAWTRFDGINARCWASLRGELFASTPRGVVKAWVGNSDYVLDNKGETIRADALQSFQYFGASTALKRFTLVRPTLLASGNPGVLYRVNTDFDPSEPTFTPGFSGEQDTSGTWGTSTWGNFTWSGGKKLFIDWQHAGAVGYSAALFLRSASKGIDVRWSATDYMFEPGGAF